MPSLDLVVLLVDDERGEAGEWLRLIRAGLRVVVARSEAYAVAETLAALEPAAMAPGTAP